MPAVAGVDSMKIVFCANEHPPAHFHAVIAEHRAVVDIAGLRIIAGSLPAASGRVLFRGTQRKSALLERFAAALAHEKVERIE
jgi:hypothetical protein